MSVTRTFERNAWLALLVAGGVASGLQVTRQPHAPFDLAISLSAPAQARDVAFKSPQTAYEQGVSAYKTGDHHIAIPAFEFISSRHDPAHKLFANFYLARIYADNTGDHTDHAKAYMLFQGIADEYADVDPDDLRRAPFVAKALTAVAIYVRDGLAETSLKPDPERALEYLRHAATFFNEPDAQFEYAKMLLVTEAQRATGLHFIEKLVRENHAGAQATLADMLDRGRFVKPDRSRALALSRMAVENAGSADAVWIGDIYQRVFCGTTGDDRQRSEGYVAQWRRTFQQQRSAVEQPSRLGRPPDIGLTRTCSNGERLDLPRRQAGSGVMAAPLQAGGGGAVNGLVPSGVRDAAPRR